MKYFFKALANYATFSGRARRSEYWYFVLFNIIFAFIFGFSVGYIGKPEWANIYTLALLLPGIAVGVRRMHDVGKSGWYLLIPFYNFVLAVTEGEAGENKYCPDPKGLDPKDQE